ncbi:MAG: hypothetical protein LIP01_13905 [Tannerellaceae bacterium]|nr:hypothetical protein [Tannerellaceae bacterium]
MQHLRILFIVATTVLLFSCKEKPTVDLIETRDRITYFMIESDPSLQKLSAEQQQVILQLLLDELDRYEKTDVVYSPLELYDQVISLIDSTEKLSPPMALTGEFFYTIAGPFLYDIGKHNHLKTHTNLNDFPLTPDSYLGWLSGYNERALSFDNLRFSADSILYTLDEHQLLNEAQLDKIGKQIFKDLNYFEETPNLTPRQTEKVKNESLQQFVVQIMNDYYFRIKEIYDEAESLALAPVEIPVYDSNLQDQAGIESLANSLEVASNPLVDEVNQLEAQGVINETQIELFSECFDRISDIIVTSSSESQLKASIGKEFAIMKAMNLPHTLYEHTALFYYAYSQEAGIHIEEELAKLLD